MYNNSRVINSLSHKCFPEILNKTDAFICFIKSKISYYIAPFNFYSTSAMNKTHGFIPTPGKNICVCVYLSLFELLVTHPNNIIKEHVPLQQFIKLNIFFWIRNPIVLSNLRLSFYVLLHVSMKFRVFIFYNSI